jgi:multidrug efflux system outer membrane protein
MKCSKSVFCVLLISVISGCGIKPKPLLLEEIADSALSDIHTIYESQESLSQKLNLSEAMARSLKYNLDNRVKLMEQAVAHKNVEMAEMDMLPMLGISAGYLDRNNVDASQSKGVPDGNISLRHSTSQNRGRANADIRFTWNILDFGVSYMQAKQNADRFLISQKTRQKVMLKLLQQVRSAYWRALIMQTMSKEVETIFAKVNTTLNDLKAVREKQLYTPLFALNDIRTLIVTKQELANIRDSINIAAVELASLINVPASSHLILEESSDFEKIPQIPNNINEMELTALLNSSDYTTELYNTRIDQMESHKALLRMLPGIEFSYSGNYASNSFLWNNLWGEAGVRLAGDLLKLATIPDTLEYSVISHQLAVSRRLAVNTAVVAGVHLAWQNYNNAVGHLKQASFLNTIDSEIAALTRNAEQNRSSSEVEAIQNEFKALGSKMAHLLSYAKAQDSFGAFLVSLGSNPVPENYQALSVTELSKLLENKYKLWENGQLEIVKTDDIKKRIAEHAAQQAAKSTIKAFIDDL